VKELRSLWRIVASRWLRGEGSEALREDSTVLDILLSGEPRGVRQSFDVRREPGVSHQAMMSPAVEWQPNPEPASE
jgi:hypothetical protein